VLGWGIVLAASFAFRRHAPLVAAGLWFYLAGHLIESSAIGLELYFEHRNYLPNLGLALATVGLVEAIARRSGKALPARLPIAVAIVLVPMLALATHAKATVWASGERIAREAVEAHPESIRAWTDLAGEAIRREDADTARAALDHLAERPRPEARKIAVLFQIVVDCAFDGAVAGGRIETLDALAEGRLSLFQQQSFGMVVDQLLRAPCEGLEPQALATTILRHADASDLPEGHFLKWRLRFHAARLHEANERHEAVLKATLPAWEAGVRDPALAAMLAFALQQTGQSDKAATVLDDALGNLRASHADRPLLEAMRARMAAPAGAAKSR
jgi:hypothetical protein